MKTAAAIIIVVAALFAIAGCDKPAEQEQSQPPTAASPRAGSSLTNPLDLQPKQPRPTFTLAIEKSATEPPAYTVVWTATVNTGGWSMVSDSVLVEDLVGKMAARIWVTVYEPQPGDIVTQAQEVLTGRYEAGTTVIETAEFSVRHGVRDAKPTFAPLYTVEKRVDA